MQESIDQAAQRIAAATSVACFTGAGISVPSGIPDYRSSGTGVWEDHDPMEVASIDAFQRDPGPFYRAYRVLGQKMLAAGPNAAHLALARLEGLGRMRAVITQNIDSLHHAAGSRRVLELHGSLRTATCLRCDRQIDFRPVLDKLFEDGTVPRCSLCGGLLKPDVVMFGEMLPTDVLAAAMALAERCEVFLCVGSSLVVFPAAALPMQAAACGHAVVILNREPTLLDPAAAVVLRGDVVETLPAVAERVADLLGETSNDRDDR